MYAESKTSEAIQCDICFEWVHAACEGLSKDQYKMFNQLVTAFPNITYCCKLHGCLACLNQLTAKATNEPANKKIKEIMKNHSILNQLINDVFQNQNFITKL